MQPDRPDIQFSVKETCRMMAKPTLRSWKMLKRIGRDVKARPRLVWRFDWQCEQDVIDVHSDANLGWLQEISNIIIRLYDCSRVTLDKVLCKDTGGYLEVVG